MRTLENNIDYNEFGSLRRPECRPDPSTGDTWVPWEEEGGEEGPLVPCVPGRPVGDEALPTRKATGSPLYRILRGAQLADKGLARKLTVAFEGSATVL